MYTIQSLIIHVIIFASIPVILGTAYALWDLRKSKKKI